MPTITLEATQLRNGYWQVRLVSSAPPEPLTVADRNAIVNDTALELNGITTFPEGYTGPRGRRRR